MGGFGSASARLLTAIPSCAAGRAAPATLITRANAARKARGSLESIVGVGNWRVQRSDSEMF